MARHERFTFVLDHQEKYLIAVLAERLQRSQSDAVRFVVLNAAKGLADIPQTQEQINLPREGTVEAPSEA